jgi:N-acetylmuramoyl-L-alanine amidase
MKFAICVGHSRLASGMIEGGAVSVGKVQEHAFNVSVAKLVCIELSELGHAVVVFSRYEGASYPGAMRWLGGVMNVAQPRFDAALELHFNSSADPASHGGEYLYQQKCKHGQRLAACLAAAHAASYPAQWCRGVLEIGSGKPGYGFLRNIGVPAVIAIPFFGSNPAEWAEFASDPVKLAATYARGLDGFAKGAK